VMAAMATGVLAAGCGGSSKNPPPDGGDSGGQTFKVVLLQTNGTPPAQKALSEVVAKANKAGYPIRIAVISSEYDLGSVSVLWGKPRTYARFLGIELSLAYKGLLLVAMPNGFGINWPGHSTAAAYKALAGVKVPAGEIGTITAAQAAVQRLVSAGGVSLASGAKAAAGSGAKATASSSSSHTASSSSGVSASRSVTPASSSLSFIARTEPEAVRGDESESRVAGPGCAPVRSRELPPGNRLLPTPPARTAAIFPRNQESVARLTSPYSRLKKAAGPGRMSQPKLKHPPEPAAE